MTFHLLCNITFSHFLLHFSHFRRPNKIFKKKDGRGGYAVLRSEHHFSCCELFSMSLSLLFRTNSRDTLPTHSIVNNRVDARRALRCFEGKGIYYFSRISAWLFCLLTARLLANGSRRQLTREMLAITRRKRKMRNVENVCRKHELRKFELECTVRGRRKAAACATQPPQDADAIRCDDVKDQRNS